MKTKTITQIGIEIQGWAIITMWGGGQGEIGMDKTFIPNNEISKATILGAVNDGQFGCQSIDSAQIEIYYVYDDPLFGYKEYNRTLFIDYPIHTAQFGKRGI